VTCGRVAVVVSSLTLLRCFETDFRHQRAKGPLSCKQDFSPKLFSPAQTRTGLAMNHSSLECSSGDRDASTLTKGARSRMGDRVTGCPRYASSSSRPSPGQTRPDQPANKPIFPSHLSREILNVYAFTAKRARGGGQVDPSKWDDVLGAQLLPSTCTY